LLDRPTRPDGDSRTAERVLMAMLLGGVAIGCVVVLYPFLSALLWAGILVFTTWPVCEWLRLRLRLRHVGAAAAMVTLTAIVVVLPLALAAPSGANDVDQLRGAVEQALASGLPGAPEWLFELPVVGPTLGELWNSSAADISGLINAFKPYLGMVVENGFSLLLGIAHGVLLFVLALFIAFFFYVYGDPIAIRLRALLERIAGPRAERLISVTGATIRGVVYGILGTAIVQGFLTAAGLYVSGVPRAFLLGAIAGFLSILPIGAPVVWIPASLWLMGSGHLGWGILLALYGGIVISGADSIIRPWFISRGAELPFVLTVLGVLGGAISFGLLGIFLGPVLLGVGYTLVKEWTEPVAPELRDIAPDKRD
jgi:predicted PurR-regulated permease PerM